MRSAATLFILALLSLQGYSQDTLDFSVCLKPDTRYMQDIDQTSTLKLTLSGSKEFKEAMKAKGFESGKSKTSHSLLHLTERTGAMSPSTYFPLSMEIHGSGESSVDGATIYGRATAQGMPELDSISMAGKSDEFKRTFLSTMQTLISQISYPSRKMKVGESFTKDIPVSMPVNGVSVSVDVLTTYTLVRIKDGLAYLDIKQVNKISGAALSKGAGVSGSGKGKGKVVYNIAAHYYNLTSMDTYMDVNIRMSTFSMKMTYRNTNQMKTEISAL